MRGIGEEEGRSSGSVLVPLSLRGAPLRLPALAAAGGGRERHLGAMPQGGFRQRHLGALITPAVNGLSWSKRPDMRLASASRG